MENNDKLLFAQISDGSRPAFDRLFRKYYGQLVRFAMGYINDGPTCEEIVQDVFIKIWENAPRISITSTVAGYFYSSVRNHCLNYIKHESIKKKHEKGQSYVNTDDNPVIGEKLNMDFFKHILSQAVKNLPVKCREIFEMAKFEGLSYDEIAEYLEVSTKTVENQMGIALKKLREAMLPYSNRIYEQ